jgi:hypothetical protein
MRKLPEIYSVVCFLTLIFYPSVSSAHPLDVTYTTLVPQNDYVDGKTYIHPFELGQLAGANNINIQIKDEFSGLSIVLFQYFRNNFEIFSAGKKLDLLDVQHEQKDLPDILADGIYLFFKIPKQDVYELKVSLFLEFSCTQSNKLILLNEAAKPVPGRPEIIFTQRRQSWILNLQQPNFSADFDDHSDQDKDGLSDHLEFLFGTDATLADTDDDGFSDFEEIYMGWDPHYPKNVEGQRSMYLNQMSRLNSSYKSSPGFSDSARYYQTGEPVVMVPTPKQGASLSSVLNSEPNFLTFPMDHFISRMQHRMGERFLQHQFLLFLVFLFGLIHVFGLNIRRHKLFRPFSNFTIPPISKIIKFVLIHMSDVLGTSIVLLYLLQKFPVADWFDWIQVVCWIGLLAIATFFLLNGLRQLWRRKKGLSGVPASTFPRWNGFFSQLDYLKPYSYRWLTFLFIISLGKIDILLTALALFGLGIFIAFLLFRRFFEQNPHHEYTGIGQIAIVLSHLVLLAMMFSVILPAIF